MVTLIEQQPSGEKKPQHPSGNPPGGADRRYTQIPHTTTRSKIEGDLASYPVIMPDPKNPRNN